MSEREQVWRERIEWQQWSGLTVAECCEEAGVSVASFYRWKKLLTEPQGSRRPRSTRKSTQRTEVLASGPKKRTSQFVPIALRDSSASPGPPQSIASDHGIASNHGNSMRLELPNGVVIHVAGDLDGQRLGDVIIAAGQIHSVLPGVTAHGLLKREVLSC
ncbi:MAG: hypothetical protein WKF77_20800 [Planctomycetaceae bacterium]